MFRAIVVEPENAGNLGFIARLVENFGIDEYVIVNPQCEIDDTARQYASRAEDTLIGARTPDTLDAAITDLDYCIGTTGVDVSDENVTRTAVPPEQMTAELPADAKTGILLGREGTGLTNDELDRCDFVVRIPTTDAYPVMNLSHAAAVLFYELFRGDSTPSDDGTGSSREQRAVLENLFKDVTGTLDWKDHRQEKTVRAFRNVLGRAYVTDKEVSLLLGWCRAVRDRCASNSDQAGM